MTTVVKGGNCLFAVVVFFCVFFLTYSYYIPEKGEGGEGKAGVESLSPVKRDHQHEGDPSATSDDNYSYKKKEGKLSMSPTEICR